MPTDEIAKLTNRQKEVLDLICQGLPTKLIGARLNLSAHTVAEYRHALLKRFGVANAVELVNQVNRMKSDARLGENPELLAALDTPPRLLVVEDDVTYRELLISELKQLGFPCQGVSCRSEMEAALAEQPVNMVLLDLNLENEDGLAIALEMRDMRPFLGIIMMTTRGMVEQRIEGLLVGADAYLVKPIDMGELVAVIRNLYRRLVEARMMAPG